MPFSNLNKAVSLFLIGGAATVWVLIVWWGAVAAVLQKIQNTPPAFLAVASALAIAIVGVMGVVIEGLTDITIRRLLKTSVKKGRGVSLLRQSRLHGSMISWRTWFLEALATSPIGARERSLPKDEEARSYQMAAGIFQTHATEKEFEWVTSHYATYYLGTSSALVAILFAYLPVQQFRVGSLTWAELVGALALVLVVTYASLSLAADRYMYTYMATFRFAALWLYEQSNPTAHGVAEIPAGESA
jgi:hypothetical protein